MILKVIFLLTVIYLRVVQGAWVHFTTYETTLPSYLVPVNMNAGDRLVATLTWPNSQDLDLYLYPDGWDLLSRNNWMDR